MHHLHAEAARKLIDRTTTLFWFRRDLRLQDNCGLLHALRGHKNVLCIFIFDTHILSALDDRADGRVDFIHQTIQSLSSELEAVGSGLVTFYGQPEAIFRQLDPARVCANNDYEPYARDRDEQVAGILKSKGASFHTFKDHVIFEKDEVVKDDNRPYTVFTPYSRKWKSLLNDSQLREYDVLSFASSFKKIEPLPLPSLEDIGFITSNTVFPDAVINDAVIHQYASRRDYPALAGTSRLSVHLRFGTISIRDVVRYARAAHPLWLNELIWREFYHMILWHFPYVEKSAFKSAYDGLAWLNDIHTFEAWCDGRTGYPMVDAGMRELNATGFMHNRVRMITASFLTKHLLIDYRWGEAYFAKKLLDFDLAANNGGWQWAAGSGCDAAPYFRIFNPALQQQRFDKDGAYIRKWIPEYGTDAYPPPIVDHNFARQRCLRVYKQSLEQPVNVYQPS